MYKTKFLLDSLDSFTELVKYKLSSDELEFPTYYQK
jgi:hypothetical protein